jgi:sulfite exporter TauE/SafE
MNAELLLTAAFVAGLFGSTHCISMCGAIVVLFETETTNQEKRRRLLQRVSYNTGRLGFYMLLGTVAGATGALLSKAAGVTAGLMILRVIAAILVIAIGLNLMFNWNITRFLEQSGAGLWRKLSPLLRHFLPVSTPGRALGAGFLWGALPCGLVYSAVAMAATSGTALGGSLVMLAFWLGTVPALLLAGTFAHKLNEWRSRHAFRRIAGAVMVLIGIIALAPWWIQPAGHSHGDIINSHATQNTLHARLGTSRIIW